MHGELSSQVDIRRFNDQTITIWAFYETQLLRQVLTTLAALVRDSWVSGENPRLNDQSICGQDRRGIHRTRGAREVRRNSRYGLWTPIAQKEIGNLVLAVVHERDKFVRTSVHTNVMCLLLWFLANWHSNGCPSFRARSRSRHLMIVETVQRSQVLARSQSCSGCVDLDLYVETCRSGKG